MLLAVRARRDVNRRALRHRGGVLSDRRARGVSGAPKSRRSVCRFAGAFRTAGSRWSPVRSRPALTPRKRSNASSGAGLTGTQIVLTAR